MSFVLSFYDPTSDVISTVVYDSSQEQTTSVSGVVLAQILEREEELTGEASCSDGFALPGGICLPRWVVGAVVLLLLAKIGFDIVKIFI